MGGGREQISKAQDYRSRRCADSPSRPCSMTPASYFLRLIYAMSPITPNAIEMIGLNLPSARRRDATAPAPRTPAAINKIRSFTAVPLRHMPFDLHASCQKSPDAAQSECEAMAVEVMPSPSLKKSFVAIAGKWSRRFLVTGEEA